jgi:23S rRNA pseudouridine2605 synthase
VRDPLAPVAVERSRLEVDGITTAPRAWRTLLFHKPRGVLTTHRDPEGRSTVYDVLGESGHGLIAVGRLDRATSGLLLMTTDTRLADWITDPRNAVPRVYLVTVRGRVSPETIAPLTAGVPSSAGELRAHAVTIRKASGRESHLAVELREGKNREVRRLFEAIGHEITRLSRVQLGGLTLGDLPPGRTRELTRDEIARAFPLAPIARP